MDWLLLNSITSASITLLFGAVFLALHWKRQGLSASRFWGISYLMLSVAMASTGIRIALPEFNPYFLSVLLAASAALGCFYLYCGIRIWRQAAPLNRHVRFAVVIPMLVLSGVASYQHAFEPPTLFIARLYIGLFTALSVYVLLTGQQRSNFGHYVTALILVGIPVSQALSLYMMFFGDWGVDGIASVSVATLLESPLAIVNFLGLPIAFTGIGLSCLLGMLLELSTRLYEESVHDWLTGCYNRRGFLELAEKVFQQATRSGSCQSLLLIDMDNFKEINDQHGHDAGDQALQMTAAVLRRRLRAGDILARWGGEEFIILLPDTDAEDAALVAESLRRHIAAQTLQLEQGGAHPLTASFGLTQRWPKDRTLDAMVTRADTALYQSKAAGKNRVTPFSISAA